MIFLLIGLNAIAAELPGEVIFKAPSDEQHQVYEVEKAAPVKSLSKVIVRQPRSGNLPQEYLKSKRESTKSHLVRPLEGASEVYTAIRVGDRMRLKVNHSVIALPDEKAPVVAIAEDVRFRGVRFIGESYLEPNSKRVFIEFQRVVIGNQIFRTKAVGISDVGQTGLEGRYYSREAEYFSGDFISSFAAGYFDSLVPRRTNIFGQIEVDATVDSAVKKGLARGALNTAERFQEKPKLLPEFSEVIGPFDLQVLILEEVRSTY